MSNNIKNETNLVEDLTLTQMTFYLNENFVKKNGMRFRIADTQGYIKRGYFPNYLGGNIIQKNNNILGVSLYNIKK